MAFLAGISWFRINKLESFYTKQSFEYFSAKEMYKILRDKGVLKNEIVNFRRISETSKIYSLLTGLAIFDSQTENISENTGIIACSREGSFEDNVTYFSDYVNTGRNIARGNLFVYTLPTSALGEAAISFKIKGPLFHITYMKNQLYNFLEHADFMINSGQSENLISFFSENNEYLCLYLTSENFSAVKKQNINQLSAQLGNDCSIKDLVHIL